MPIIQFVMPSRNKQLKKLLHFYWEVCPKYDENGKLKQEMILVVCVLTPSYLDFKLTTPLKYRNAIRNDLVCFLQLISVLMAQRRKATPKRIHSGRKSTLPAKNRQGC